MEAVADERRGRVVAVTDRREEVDDDDVVGATRGLDARDLGRSGSAGAAADRLAAGAVAVARVDREVEVVVAEVPDVDPHASEEVPVEGPRRPHVELEEVAPGLRVGAAFRVEAAVSAAAEIGADGDGAVPADRAVAVLVGVEG